MLKIGKFECNMFGEITYIVWDAATRQAAVIDPGMSTENECKAVDNYIEDNDLDIKYLLNTHIHLDHTFGIGHIESTYGVKLSASPADAPLAERIQQQAVMFHLPFRASNVEIAHPLVAGDVIKLGETRLVVIEVPGHTPGGLAFYAPEDHIVFTGDSLFHSSIGRTDLPGGDHTTLVKAVTGQLLSLPDNTTVYPGHGPATTIGHERNFNPYL